MLVVATLLQLIVIVLAARLAAAAVFNPVAGEPMQVLSQIGLLLLMFQIGSDFHFELLSESRNRKATIYVALASVVTPLIAGAVLGWISAPILAPGIDRVVYTAFVAIALAITAVPMLGRILREYGLHREETGVIAISAAAGNDVAGWVLLAAVAAFASTGISAGNSALQLGGLVALMVGLWFLGRPATEWVMRRFPLEDGAISPALMGIVLAAIFLAGVATEKLGIFTIFGGFLVGLLVHRHTDFVAAWQKQIGQFVLVFFLPIFFTYTGLRTNILGLTTGADWLWCLGIFIVATLAKVVPVYFAARAARFEPPQAGMIGVMMNTRGLMELIVLNVGLSLGFIPQNVFTMLVIMAVGTTLMTAPLLRWSMARQGRPLSVLAEG
jgi:Kef-type K+ transport system membrane component KefB